MRKFLGTYLFTVALIIVIIVVFDFVERADDFMELHAPFKAIVFDYYFNFIPSIINQFSGLFTFISVIFFTSKMAYQTEIIAMLSGGMSFRRLMWPYFISALAITMLSLSLNMWIIPRASDRMISFQTQYFKKAKRNAAKFDKHIYRQLDPGVFIYIRDYVSDDRGQRAGHFAIEKYVDNSIVAILDAADVKFDPETKHWTAPRYITRTFIDGEETFEQHDKGLDTLINLDAMELGRVETLVKTMNIGELNEFIDQQREKGSDMMNVFEVERTQRYAYPAATFILTLIGVSLSSRKVRGGTGLHIGIGITLCFSYILFAKFAEEFAKSGSLPPSLAVWLPNIIYLVIALYLYKKAPK